jgi:hypothetical protein
LATIESQWLKNLESSCYLSILVLAVIVTTQQSVNKRQKISITQTSVMTEDKPKQTGYGFGTLLALGMTFGVALGAAYGVYSGDTYSSVGTGLIIGAFAGLLFGIVKNRK